MTKIYLLATLVSLSLAPAPAISAQTFEGEPSARRAAGGIAGSPLDRVLLCGSGTTSQQQGQSGRPRPPSKPAGGRGKGTGGKTVSG